MEGGQKGLARSRKHHVPKVSVYSISADPVTVALCHDLFENKLYMLDKSSSFLSVASLSACNKPCAYNIDLITNTT